MNLPLFSLQDQIAIVTGAAKGIGKGIAAVLRQAGATVVVADIDEAAGQATAQALGADFYPLDVTHQADCRRRIGTADALFTDFQPVFTRQCLGVDQA